MLVSDVGQHVGVVCGRLKSTKLRIVYDASSKLQKGMNSLKDCLFNGSSLTPLLFDVILTFRINPIAFICDIRNAFLQIRINKADRDALRFLWLSAPYADEPDINIRVPFCLSCSPFLLNGTLRCHLTKFMNEHPGTVREIGQIINSSYVDDCAGGYYDVDSASKLYTILKDVLKKGGFTVHKFLTNDPALRINVADDVVLNQSDTSIGNSCDDGTKILGIPWSTSTDTLRIEFDGILDKHSKTPTKRHILSILAKLSDPFGFVGSVVLPYKSHGNGI